MKYENNKEFLKIVLPNKDDAPQVYFKGEKIIGDDINNLFIEQLNFNYLTNTVNKHHNTLSISGFRTTDDQSILPEQFIASFEDLEKLIEHVKDANVKEEQAKHNSKKES